MRGVAFVLAGLLCGCAHQATVSNPSADLQRLTDEFTRTHYEHRPLAAVSLGWHQYDGQFVIPTAKSLADEIARLKKFDAEFARIPAGKISPAEQHDLNLLKATIAYERWVHEKQRPYWQN